MTEDFSIHKHMGVKHEKARELEIYLLDTMKDAKSLPNTISRILRAKKLSYDGKALTRKERDYLLLLLGMYIRRNQEAYEESVLHGIAEEPEDDDEY